MITIVKHEDTWSAHDGDWWWLMIRTHHQQWQGFLQWVVLAYDWFLMLQTFFVESPSANMLDIIQSRHGKRQTFKTNEHVLMSLFPIKPTKHCPFYKETSHSFEAYHSWTNPYVACPPSAGSARKSPRCQHFGFTWCEGLTNYSWSICWFFPALELWVIGTSAAFECHRVVSLSLNSDLLMNTRVSILDPPSECGLSLNSVGLLPAPSAAICKPTCGNRWMFQPAGQPTKG